MRKKVAIIDDDKKLLAELSSMLSGNGFDVYPYSEGCIALHHIPAVMPDIILLDLQMDNVSGFQVADKLRCSAKTHDIPVIAMTGYYMQDEYSLLMKMCGLRNCILKPFNPDEVLQEISDAINNG